MDVTICGFDAGTRQFSAASIPLGRSKKPGCRSRSLPVPSAKLCRMERTPYAKGHLGFVYVVVLGKGYPSNRWTGLNCAESDGMGLLFVLTGHSV